MNPLRFSSLTLGAGRIGSAGSRLSLESLSKLAEVAGELDIHMIDTADSYASGESERQIGRLCQTVPCSQIVTKVGYRYGTLPGSCYLLNQVIKKALHLAGMRQCFSPSYVRRSVHRSGFRLGRKPVLCLLHNPPLEALTPDLRHALQELVTGGAAGAFGLSSFEPEVLRAGMQWPEIAVLQSAVNPDTARQLQPVLEEAARRSIPVMAHSVSPASCLAEDSPFMKQAAAMNVEPRHLLIQFALQQPGVATVITGTHSAEHMRTNAAWAATRLQVDFNRFMR